MQRILTLLIVGLTLTGCAEWERERAAREQQQQDHEFAMQQAQLATRRAIAHDQAVQQRQADVERARVNRPVKIVAVVALLTGGLWAGLLTFRYYMKRANDELLIATLPYLDPEQQREVAQRLLNGPDGPRMLEHKDE